MEELISIIMSTYNEDIEWLKESIESILKQTYQNLEFIIVLDNPKNKRIKEVVTSYQMQDNRIKVISNKTNIGLVQSLNIALKSCKGKYIARMDADDISLSERIYKEKVYLEKNKLDFVFSDAFLVDETNKKINSLKRKKNKAIKLEEIIKYQNIAFHPTWFLKRELYEQLKGYREIPYCEDYDFLLRAFSSSYKIGRIDEKLLNYRLRMSSISRSYTFEQFLNTKELLRLYKCGQLQDDISTYNSFYKLNKKTTAIQKKKFLKAEVVYQQGIDFMIDGKYIKGGIKKIKSSLISKVYFQLLFSNFLIALKKLKVIKRAEL